MMKNENNRGFTLVELLIAITILAIIVIPLLHAFVSSARTNAKAHKTMRATTIAENIMEEFEERSMEELEKKYLLTQNGDGTYFFTLLEAQLSEFGSNAFTAKVELDPNTSYSDYNKKGMTEVSPITALNNAIYVMGATYDESIYDIFASKSEAAAAENTIYSKKDAAYFREKIHRTISVDIQKGVMVTDDLGNTFPEVKVLLDITYEYRENAVIKALWDTDTKYSVEKTLFDNTGSKEPLKDIYIMYNPRYKACCDSGKEDVFVIRNDGNVETELTLLCQKTTEAEDLLYRNTYFVQQKAKITIYEKPTESGAFSSSTKGALKLRTNLHSEADATDVSRLQLKLIYRSYTQIASQVDSEKILRVTMPDGKSLDGKALKNRIYEMRVSVYHTDKTTPLVVLNGTKLD